MQTKWIYMPILKWKQGEQMALRYLTEQQWDGVTPMLKLPPINSAPDASSLKIELPNYLNKIVEQIKKNIPEDTAVCIDSEYVSLGYEKQLALLLLICNSLQKNLNHQIIPAIQSPLLESLPTLSSIFSGYLHSVEDVVICFRTDQIAPTQIAPAILALTKYGIKKREIHLLIDQYSLVGSDHRTCYSNIKPYLDDGVAIGCASVTVGGGSFPINLMGYKQGVTDIPRVEWLVWSLIQQSGDYTDLRYADYTVTNPAPQPDIDPTQVNPSVAIRYAANQFWKLYKAKGFKKGPPDQYRNLCKLLISDVVYSQPNFSYGDSQYSKAASGKIGNGNPSSWRKDATNHHIALTVDSL